MQEDEALRSEGYASSRPRYYTAHLNKEGYLTTEACDLTGKRTSCEGKRKYVMHRLCDRIGSRMQKEKEIKVIEHSLQYIVQSLLCIL